MKNLFKINTEKGFTLIETFVAIGILMLALVGPMTLAQQALSNATVSGDQITAFFLAQDAMEYIRNIRDSNIKSGSGWLDGIPSSCIGGVGNVCRLDTTLNQPVSNSFAVCNGAGCTLQYNVATNRYLHNTSFPDSPFRREIEIEEIVSNQEILVTITIFWTSGRFTGTFAVEQSMFNFAP